MNPDRIARSGDVSGILDLIEPLVKSVAQSFSTIPAKSESCWNILERGLEP